MKIGTTTLPLAGWMADPQQPEAGREQRLAAIRRIVEGYGLAAVELTLDLAMVFPQVFDAGFYSAVAGLQQQLGFVCSVHLPFLWVDLCSLNESMRRASIACLRQAIELTESVEVDTYVLHLWGFTTTQIARQLQHPAQRQVLFGALLLQAQRSLAEVCEVVAPSDLCVENLEDSVFDLALPLIEQAGASICLDVGHLAWHAEDELSFLAKHRDRIREVHLHDALTKSPGGDSPIRDHLALGQGEIDYTAFLRKLQEIEFQGPVILELNSKAELEESLERVQPFL
jgi:sugar phosphate isomerase/epimerase